MRRILRKSLIPFLLLFSLLVNAGLFEVRSGASVPVQAGTLIGGLSRSSSSLSVSQLTSTGVGNGDVQVTVTAYREGKVYSETVPTAGYSSGSAATDISSAPSALAQPAVAGDIVISQIYSNGGNVGSTFQHNYLELFNRTNSAIDFAGWRIFPASASGTFDVSVSFTSSRGVSIGAQKYLLIQFGPDSANGAPLAPDFAVPFTLPPIPGIPPLPPINLSPSGKVFLTRPNTNLFGATCVPNSEIVDFVGYGSAANCFEGTGPAATITNTTAAVRKLGGCTDSEDNANDFLANAPNPRNSSSPANNCSVNQIDVADFFVRQHYADFLNRQPDAAGLSFWINQITSCGTDTACIEVKRINVSAAFFLSIEFQETGYLVYRTYKVAYGNMLATPVPLRLDEFLPDSQQISQGVVVNAPGWEQQLANNKNMFFVDFVSRLRFRNEYPITMSPAQFVDALFNNAGVGAMTTERTDAINEFGTVLDTTDTAARARALQRVAENQMLGQQEKNKAFVLMQYFGYLRRNPNDPPEPGLGFDGYDFWLNKLNQFNGNFINAEMVKAFITSGEYRQRF